VTIAQHGDDIDAVALHPNGRTLTGHTDDIHALAFSRDGHLLATTSWDHTVMLWDVTEPRRPIELAILTGRPEAVLAVAFSPDGRTLVISSPDRTIRLWDITDPRAPLESAHLNGHTDTAQGLAFSPDGRSLATAANDHTARLRDVTTPAEPHESAVLTGHTNRVRILAFVPDGHTLVTGSTDQTARLRETDPERTASRICAVAHPRNTPRQWEAGTLESGARFRDNEMKPPVGEGLSTKLGPLPKASLAALPLVIDRTLIPIDQTSAANHLLARNSRPVGNPSSTTSTSRKPTPSSLRSHSSAESRRRVMNCL
jgi:WD40 repeat protein